MPFGNETPGHDFGILPWITALLFVVGALLAYYSSDLARNSIFAP